MLNQFTNQNAKAVQTKDRSFIVRISIVLLVIISAAGITARASAAPAAFIDSVSSFLGIGAATHQMSLTPSAMNAALVQPMSNGLLVPGSMMAVPVPCTEIDVSWENASSSNTYADLQRTAGPTFDPNNFVNVLHFQGNNKNLLSGVVTYTDSGLTVGQTYSYRITVVKVTGNNTTVEFLEANGIMLQTMNCLTSTAVAPSATPGAISVGTGGTIALSAAVTKVTGPSTDPISGTVTFTVRDPANISVSQTTVPLNTLTGIATSSINANLVSGAAGNYLVTADYNGDTNYNASSGSTAISVGVATSTTSLVSSLNPSNAGDSVTFTATVSTGGPPPPTGIVKFYDSPTCGGPQIGTDQTLSAGQTASVTTSALSLGVHTIRACYQGNGNYSASTAMLSQTVNPAVVTAAVTASDKVYDGTTAATITNCTLTGVAPADAANVTCTAAGPNTFDFKDAGSRTVTATNISLSGSAASNYTLGSATATTPASITPLPLTVTVTGIDKSYDGTTAASVSLSITPMGGDTVSVVYGSASFLDANAGNGKTVNVAGISLVGADGGNYSVSSSGSTTANINPALVTATAGSGSTTYDGLTHSPSTCAISGPGFLGDVACTNSPASVGPSAGTTTISPSVTGSALSNFTVTPVDGSYTIDKRQAIATANPVSGEYTNSPFAGNASCSDGLTPSIVYTPGPGAPVNVSSTTFQVTCGDGNTNFIDGTASSTIDITAAASVTTVSCPSNATFTGSAIEPCTYTVSGTGLTTIGPLPVPSVNYANNINAGLAGASFSYGGDANHSSSSDSESFTIDAAATTTTVDCSPNSFVFNGSAIEPCTATVTGPGMFSQSLTPSYVGDTTNAGTVTANASFAAAGNYLGSSDSDSYVITAAGTTTTVTCSPNSFVYTGSPIEPCTVTVTGAAGLSLTPTLASGDYSNNVAVGANTASASYTYAGGGNYSSSSDSDTFSITSGSIAGSVTYLIAPKPVPNVTLTAAGTPGTMATSIADGSYFLTNFGAGAYTVTPSKATQQCTTLNGIFSNDAALIAQHVVGLNTLTSDQLAAAKVAGLANVSSFDAALIAQKVVGICSGINQSGQWRFSSSSTPYANVLTDITGANYTAYMMGDVSGDWDPTAVAHRGQLASRGTREAVIASLGNVTGDQGSEISVPFRIDNLGGKAMTSYQFDVTYDAAVVRPSEAAANIAGTMGEGLAVVFNAVQPGLLRVAVYGAIPVSGDGVYAELKFTVLGGKGSTTPLTITDFRFNNGENEVIGTSGQLTVGNAVNSSSLRGSVLTATGTPVADAKVVIANVNGRSRTITVDAQGRFAIAGLTLGETYTVNAAAKSLTFTPVTVSISDANTTVDIIAEQ